MLKNLKQKKILILILSVFLIVTMFTLTGCGPRIGTEGQGGNETQDGGEVQSGDNQGTPNDNGQQGQQGQQLISSVLQEFDEHRSEALVKFSNDNNYYVINRDGKAVYSFSEPNVPTYSASDMKYYNGYLLVNRETSSYGEEEQRLNYVKDLRDGSTKLEGTDSIEYIDITESGYVLQRATIESLGGTTYESRIVDLNGNVVWKHEDNYSVTYFATIVGDVVAYCANTYSDENYTLINAKTGKTIDLGFHCVAGYFDCQVFGDYLLVGVSANNDKYSVVDLNTFTKTNTRIKPCTQNFK